MAEKAALTEMFINKGEESRKELETDQQGQSWKLAHYTGCCWSSRQHWREANETSAKIIWGALGETPYSLGHLLRWALGRKTEKHGSEI